jgi:hypothetical protein
MIEQAQTFTPDQLNAFMVVLGGILVANAGQMVAWVYRNIQKKFKGEADIRAAHDKIRELTKRVERLEGE